MWTMTCKVARLCPQTFPARSSISRRSLPTNSQLIEGKPIESIELSSVYTRITGIAGQPLNDNNLGQTIINNYGRPYQQGINNSTGFTARAEDGRFAFYVNGEYQHAPSAPAYPLLTRQVIASVNHDPLQPATTVSYHQPVPPARYVRDHAIPGTGYFSWETKPGLGPHAKRLDGDEQ